MGKPTHEANGNHEHLKDLTQIRGIGVVKKRWLNSLGIKSIADLATASADAIEAKAKIDGRTISRDELEEWIAQAQVQHVQASLEHAESTPNTVATISPAQNPNLVAGEQADSESKSNLTNWESFVSFKVDYQTRQVNGKTEKRFVAHCLDTDEIESWDDFEPELMQQWLRDHIEAALPSLPPIESLTIAKPITAEITQLRVMQPHHTIHPMIADQNTPIFSDAIQTAKPFAMEVSMHFEGLPEANQAKQVAYRVQCLARNLATGITDSLGDVTAHVSPSKDSTYKVLLPSLLLLQPGTYRLKVLVALQNAPAALGHFKVPMLQVV